MIKKFLKDELFQLIGHRSINANDTEMISEIKRLLDVVTLGDGTKLPKIEDMTSEMIDKICDLLRQ
jgi:hypothetical protein